MTHKDVITIKQDINLAFDSMNDNGLHTQLNRLESAVRQSERTQLAKAIRDITAFGVGDRLTRLDKLADSLAPNPAAVIRGWISVARSGTTPDLDQLEVAAEDLIDIAETAAQEGAA